MAADIAFLTNDHLEGREAGSAGGDSTAVFLADRYAQLGVIGAFDAPCSPAPSCIQAYSQVFRVAGMQAENVAALVRGSDPDLRGQYVIVGAHYDHLGRSARGAMDPERGAELRVGADDNASGTAALLQLGQRLAANPAPISVVLVHFDAEELGLFGSEAFVADSPIPLDSIALMLNLDMVGRLRGGHLIAEALAGADRFRGLIEQAALEQNVPVDFSRIERGQTDHWSFVQRDVPAVALFTGFHEDYHRASDTADKLDLLGLARIVDLTEDLVRSVGSSHLRRGGSGLR
ncbi:MAG: M28 family peptidase [Dehalococcoidia bacterium]